MSSFRSWLHAARLRTLPLALSSIFLGGILAGIDGYVNLLSFSLAVIVTIILQVLSNFANDYGDFSSGVDVEGRVGPARALQSGMVTRSQMKKAMILLTGFALVLGILLIWTSELSLTGKISLLLMGIAAIVAAITYTVGDKPYGYRGLGDLAVFIFFGLLGVLGSHWIVHGTFHSVNLLLAATAGFFSAGVLNLNNMRDRKADRAHGKNTLPVLMGARKARIYHSFLLSAGWLTAILYTWLKSDHWYQWLFLAALPLFIYHGRQLSLREDAALDPLLKQLSLSTLIFVILFGLSWLPGNPAVISLF